MSRKSKITNEALRKFQETYEKEKSAKDGKLTLSTFYKNIKEEIGISYVRFSQLMNTEKKTCNDCSLENISDILNKAIVEKKKQLKNLNDQISSVSEEIKKLEESLEKLN